MGCGSMGDLLRLVFLSSLMYFGTVGCRVGMIYIDDIYPRYISDIFNFENIQYFQYFHISATYLDKIA